MNAQLKKKVAIITGANQGLGLEIAKAYAQAGADLMLCARNESLLQESVLQLQKLTNPNQQILYKACDISNKNEVRELVSRTISQLGKCDILVNNAGIYGPKGEIESVDWDEWTKTIEINVFGSILMCRELVPYFKNQGSGKIIQLSGGGATNPMPRISAYATSKAAIIRFSETLAEEVREFGIDVNAIAPGALNTRMLNEILEAGPEKVGKDFYERSLKQKSSGGTPFERSAELAVFLGSDASNGITGKLISAVWDKWQEWPNNLNKLNSSDIYTLRRITGRDRGEGWGDA